MRFMCLSQAVLITGTLAGTLNSAATAEQISWADGVVSWLGDIENYGLYAEAENMMSATTWWLTGPPDADQNDNGYAWDLGDTDTVAGWRSSGAADFTLRFDVALADQPGDDLLVVGYGGTGGRFAVHASPDGDDYVLVGSTNGAGAGDLTDYWFDYAGLVDDVRYVRILREVSGPQTGMFFDAVGGYVIPEPSTIGLIASGVFCMVALRIARRSRRKAPGGRAGAPATARAT